MTDMIESTELLAFKWQKDGYEVTVKISFWIVLSWDELKVRQNLPYFTKFLGLHTENSGIHFSNAHKNNKKIRKKREKLKKTDKKFKIRTRTNKRLKVTEDNKWVNWYHLHNMAGGHVFCAPRNLCVFLFTYLSFTTLLNVDCSWSIFSTPERFCIFPNSFPCLQYRAKEHPNWNLLDRLVQDTTSWKFISALLWCSTLPTQWWWFVCPMTYLWILDRQVRSLQIYLPSAGPRL